MKKKSNVIILTVFLLIAITFSFALSGSAPLLKADEPPEKNYYVCFSNQNYAVRNANKMTKVGDDYVLENVTVSSAWNFYVTDNEGIKYFDKYGDEMRTEEEGSFSYNIKFNPVTVFGTEENGYKATGAHITYSFCIPATYSLEYNEGTLPLSYNPYETAYEEHLVSNIHLSAGDVIRYGTEEKTISSDGEYRILFTPGKTEGGNTYMFNENGRYGTGEDYVYRIYIEDAPIYYAAFVEETVTASDPETIISGEPAFRLLRDESSNLAVYAGGEFFAPEPGFVLKYRIYEERPDGTHRLIDDDADPDTTFSKSTISEVGWYEYRFTDGGDAFAVAFSENEYDYCGWYAVGNINGWGFTELGELDLNDGYKFVELDESDADYNDDYVQYRLTLNITRKQLKNENVEFYIFDGSTRFMNLARHIEIEEPGKYEFLFSPEHNYGRGRYYRYSLVDDNIGVTGEVIISDADEFKALIDNCNESSDYSYGLNVYIAADIDFSGAEINPIRVFNGTIYGGYHTLKGFRIASSSPEKSLIGVLTRRGKIERLKAELNIDAASSDYAGLVGKNYGTISYVEVSGTVNGARYVGAVAGYNGRTAETTGGTENVFINGVITGCLSTASVTGSTNVGGLAGFNDGEVLKCTSAASVTGKSRRANTAPVNVGGVVGYSSGRISECYSVAAIDGELALNVGGVAGLCTGEVYFSIFAGKISATRYGGGIVGYYGRVSNNESDRINYFGGISYEDLIAYFSEDSGDYEEVDGRTNLISYCLFDGAVDAQSYAGGIIGTSSVAFDVRNCFSTGEVKAKAGSYAGGIAGSGDAVSFYSCQSVGKVESSGIGGGNYVGGIAGSAANVYYCTSSSELLGKDYIGGIAGQVSGRLTGCYTNVWIHSEEGSTHVGDIAGYASTYDEGTGKFGGNVKYNYFTGTVGGIAGLNYGMEVDYAATHLNSDELKSKGVLSLSLAKGFSSDYWLAGDEDEVYPLVRAFEICDVAEEYGDDDEFESVFYEYAEEFGRRSLESSYPTHIVVLMEWDKDKGKLLNDDGTVNTASFTATDSVRVSEGTEGGVNFVPIYGEYHEKSGRYMYDGGTEKYFEDVVNPTGVITSSMTIYASYHEVVTTISGEDDKLLVEGFFEKGTEAALIPSYEGYRVEIKQNGETVDFEEVTVAYFVGNDIERASVKIVTASGVIDAESEIVGSFIKFRLKSNEGFAVQIRQLEETPVWIIIGVSGGAGALTVGIAFTVVLVILHVRRKKKTKTL